MQSERLDLSARSQFPRNCFHSMCVRLAMPIDSFLSNINHFRVGASRQVGNSGVIGQPERTSSNQSVIAGAICGQQPSHWSQTQASSNCKGSREMARLGEHPAPGSNCTRHLPEPNSVIENRLGGCAGSLRTQTDPQPITVYSLTAI